MHWHHIVECTQPSWKLLSCCLLCIVSLILNIWEWFGSGANVSIIVFKMEWGSPIVILVAILPSYIIFNNEPMLDPNCEGQRLFLFKDLKVLWQWSYLFLKVKTLFYAHYWSVSPWTNEEDKKQTVAGNNFVKTELSSHNNTRNSVIWLRSGYKTKNL
jgi:hypothetical protein